MYTFVFLRIPFVCASKGDPYIHVKGAIQHIKSMMRVLELLPIQFIAQFCGVGSIFAQGLTVACKLHPSDSGHSTWPNMIPSPKI